MLDQPVLPQSLAAEEERPAFGERRFGRVNWLGLQTLVVKEIRRFMKVAFQTIFAPVISTILFLLVFMLAFGRAKTFVDGVPYTEFLAPGLIMMAILTNAFANSSSSIIIGKVQGSIVDILMPPLSASELTVAFVIGAAARGLLVGLVTAITSALFMAFSDAPMSIAEPWAIAYFSLAAAFIFGMIGVAGGIWAEKFDQLAAVTNFVITPLTFLSGTFYSIKNLPEPFLTISHYNPVFYLIDGFRYGFTGQYDASPAAGAAATGVITIVLGYFCYRLFKSGYKLKS
ncbi:MAG: multidrug ABC transporter permease [Alphaproteobacteria bacterium]|nr:multidrug ABC transporter permease [Alphaproteobacteria bacterium]